MDQYGKLRHCLAHAIRRLYERGLVSGVGGNASVMLPSRKEVFITPMGFFKGGIAEGDLVKVSLEGRTTGRGTPSSEMATHLMAYKVRRDINAVVHGHPPVAVALTTAGVKIPTMTPEHAALIPAMKVVKFALPGEQGAKAVCGALKRYEVVGIMNHGFFSLGTDLHEAVSRLEVLEESAIIYLVARQFGRVSVLEEDDCRSIREAYATRKIEGSSGGT